MQAFNARAIFNTKFDRRYRAFPDGGKIYFIKTGSQEIGQAAAHHFGLIGALVHLLIRKKLEARAARRQQELDAMSPQQLLGTHKHNFLASPELVRSLTVMKRPAIPLHGPCVARMRIEWVQQEPLLLQFDRDEDLALALATLPKVFGEKFRSELK